MLMKGLRAPPSEGPFLFLYSWFTFGDNPAENHTQSGFLTLKYLSPDLRVRGPIGLLHEVRSNSQDGMHGVGQR